MSLSKRATAGGFLSFFLLGAVQALYGPLIPVLRSEFGLSAADAGLILGAQFVGSVLGVLASGVIEGRVGPRRRAGVAAALFALGCGGVAFAPSWPFAVATALLIGLGYGGLNVTFLSLFSRGFGARSPTVLNLLAVCYGVGAVIGPLVVGQTLESGFRLPFLLSALVAVLALPLVLAAPGPPSPVAPRDPATPGGPRTWKVLAAFGAVYFLYGGVEVVAGGWQATHLGANGVAEVTAANLTAVYWGTLTIGRLLVAPFSANIPPGRLAVVSLGLGAVVLGLTHVPALATFAYPLAGLALAAFAPAGVVWISRTLPNAHGAVAVVLIGLYLGGVVFPTLVGQLITATSPAVVPTASTLIALMAVAVAVGLLRVGTAPAIVRPRTP